MIASIWTITWDPDGTPLTLAASGDKLNLPPPMSVRQMVESAPIIEAETEHYPRDHREGLPWTLEVIEQHATLIANITNIRTEIISRYPNNHLDAWAMPNTTDGTADTGYRRFNSAATEDNFHPNDDWYVGYIAALRTMLASKAWA